MADKFHAVPPQVGLAALLSLQEAELRARQEQISASRLALEYAVAEYTDIQHRQHYAGAEQLVGIDSIRSRIETLAQESTSEILGFAPSGAQTEANMEASKPLDAATLGRGVRLRTIYLGSITKDSVSMSYAQWLIEHGGAVRTMPTLPLRMIIYDRRKAIVPMDPDDSAAGALLLSSAGVVTALCELFEQTWEQASSLGVVSTPTDEGLTPQERAVLTMLAQGNTDDAVARKLGVSVRTGRRIMANLTTRLGAQSRFQAGARAAMRGWLDSVD